MSPKRERLSPQQVLLLRLVHENNRRAIDGVVIPFYLKDWHYQLQNKTDVYLVSNSDALTVEAAQRNLGRLVDRGFLTARARFYTITESGVTQLIARGFGPSTLVQP